MIFHRVTWTDANGFVNNNWLVAEYPAQQMAVFLKQDGMIDVHVDKVDIPTEDPVKFRTWLNENPNTPHMADSTETFMPINENEVRKCSERVAAVDTGADQLPLEWPPIDERRVGTPAEMAAPYGQERRALDSQVGGDHYRKLGNFQPWEVLRHWLTAEEFRGYMKGQAIVYLARERDKGGDEDVGKAEHYCRGLLELQPKGG